MDIKLERLLKKGPREDITGNTYHNLYVEKMEPGYPSKNSQNTVCWMAICKCLLCGKRDIACVPNIIKGKHAWKKDCGCGRSIRYNQKTGKNSPYFKGYEEISGRFIKNIQCSAKNRKIEYELDIKNLWKLFLKQKRKCALSGADIHFPSKVKSKGTASLDRIDHTKGYIIDNVQWVHKEVNLMKMYLDEDVFIEWCKLIAKNN